jgi:aryl-alcohol dehydrogenase-like predicted oxidoreductase
MNSEIKVPLRKLGSQGLLASAQGLGTMGMTAFYSATEVTEEEKIDAIGRGLELGINFIDTAYLYQNFQTGETNEALVGKALKKYGRDKFVVATKCGIQITSNGLITTGDPKIIRQQCEESLKRLDIECIDLYYLHRIDPEFPLETTMQCLLELRNEGKIKHVGLSECTPEELERAHKVFPISAIQMEWSLQTRDIEKTLVPVARQLGVAIVAYSPLGRGLLSRTFSKKEDLKEGDWRTTLPRFSEENIDENVEAVEKLEKYALSKGYTTAQIALAWLHNQGDDVFPIPGTKTAKRLEENAKGALIKLTHEEMAEIEAMIPEPKGTRYQEELMKRTYQARI